MPTGYWVLGTGYKEERDDITFKRVAYSTSPVTIKTGVMSRIQQPPFLLLHPSYHSHSSRDTTLGPSWKDPHLRPKDRSKKKGKSISPKEIEQGSHQAITSASTAPKCPVHLLVPQPKTGIPGSLWLDPQGCTRSSRLTHQGPLACPVSEAFEDINGRSLAFYLGTDIDATGSLASHCAITCLILGV
jgi:hypothetical protein